ncbi:WG repeat-containing protein [bacterium]|nr:WG repeat-containing protein [bacterium]MBP9811462.1 WG repeat-containing protein [bacterium]
MINKKQQTSLVAIALAIICCFADTQAQSFAPNIYRENGNDHGLTDLKGRQIVAAAYPNIRYLSHGLFLLWQRSANPADRFTCKEERLLFNRSGMKIKTEVPAGTTFENLYWLGQQAETDKAFVPDTLPSDALLTFKSGEYFGLCDRNGNIVLPASFSYLGQARDGQAVLRQADEQLLVLNTRNHMLQKVCVEDAYKGVGMTFSDGLAPFRTNSCWGYIDASGKVAIEPRFHSVTDFKNGRALVNVLDATGKTCTGIVINQKGEIVSPPNLKIAYLCGNIAVGCLGSGKWCALDREFKYLIKPEYIAIHPLEGPYFSQEEALALYCKDPLFYLALRSNDEPPVVLSSKGNVLLTLPEGINFSAPGRETVYDGVIQCSMKTDALHSKTVYFNLQGQLVQAPYSKLSNSDSVTFREIAPGILLKTVKCSDELYRQQLSRSGCFRTSNRQR